MGKASSNKKVARAAGTGGGRTARGRRPYGWYSVLSVLVALGVFLVAFSRHQVQAVAAVHPRGNDHWHDAYGIDICGKFQAALAPNPNLGSASGSPGIHTHGDGLMHIEPYVSGLSADAGTHATVARFAQDYPGFVLTSTTLQLPGQKAYHNGDKCNGKPAQVRIRFWSKANQSASITYTNPNDVRLNNGGAITVAFLPADADIPKPPLSALNALSSPNAKEPGQASTSTTLPGTTNITVAPPTTAPGGPATTTGAKAPPGTSPPTTR
jgi:hypothetical protein